MPSSNILADLKQKYSYQVSDETSSVEMANILRTLRSKTGKIKKHESKTKAKAKIQEGTVLEHMSSSRFKYHPSELRYQHLEEIPNLLKPNMRLMFCGFNPGIQSAVTGHRYAHVTNLFWRLLVESGLFIPRLPLKELPSKEEVYFDFGKGAVTKEDMLYIIKTLTFNNAEKYLFDTFDIGWTDLVSRPTRNIKELTSKEMDDNVPILVDRIALYQPKMVCFIGKDIFKRLFAHIKKESNVDPKNYIFDKNFVWGKQNNLPYYKLITDYFAKKCSEQLYVPIIHVFPSTSGLVGSIRKETKLQLFIELKNEFDSLKEEV